MSRTTQKSASVSKVQDRRVRRTRAHLQSAFAELLLHRSYDAIRVTDIARKADVGRATFYAHYDRKDDLLRAELGRILGALLVPRPEEPCLLDGTRLFAHLRQARRVYRALMRGTEGPAVSRMMRDIVEQRVTDMLALRRIRTPQHAAMPVPVVARFVAASLLALVDWWEEHGMRQTPDEMQAVYRALVGGGVGAVISGQASR